MKVQLLILLCKKCGHKWTPRNGEIKICPKCKTKYWNGKKK